MAIKVCEKWSVHRFNLAPWGRTHGIGAFMGVFWTTAALLADANMAARASVLAALDVTKGAVLGRAPCLGVATALEWMEGAKCQQPITNVL